MHTPIYIDGSVRRAISKYAGIYMLKYISRLRKVRSTRAPWLTPLAPRARRRCVRARSDVGRTVAMVRVACRSQSPMYVCINRRRNATRLQSPETTAPRRRYHPHGTPWVMGGARATHTTTTSRPHPTLPHAASSYQHLIAGITLIMSQKISKNH